MNFWTFADRNMLGIMAIVGLLLAYSFGSCGERDRSGCRVQIGGTTVVQPDGGR